MDVKIFYPYCGKQMSTSDVINISSKIEHIISREDFSFLQRYTIQFYCEKCIRGFVIKKEFRSNIDNIFKE